MGKSLNSSKTTNLLREGCMPFDVNVNTDDTYHHYILRELRKAKQEAQKPDALWHSEDDLLKMLEETHEI